MVLSRVKQAARRRLVSAVEQGVDARVAELTQRVADLERAAADRHAEVLDALVSWERRTRRDVMTAVEREAAVSSGRYMVEHMHDVRWFVHPHDTLRHAVESVRTDGLALEFGVATGSTLRVIAETHRRGPVVGFDSFQGLPEAWRTGYPAGEFAQSEPPEVPGAELVVGLFEDTLPGFLAQHPGPVALLHVDSDLYSSAVTVLEQVGPRLVPGSVVVFDEYFNFPGWPEHEHRAWTEHVERTGIAWRYLGMTMDDEQVSVLVTG